MMNDKDQSLIDASLVISYDKDTKKIVPFRLKDFLLTLDDNQSISVFVKYDQIISSNISSCVYQSGKNVVCVDDNITDYRNYYVNKIDAIIVPDSTGIQNEIILQITVAKELIVIATPL